MKHLNIHRRSGATAASVLKTYMGNQSSLNLNFKPTFDKLERDCCVTGLQNLSVFSKESGVFEKTNLIVAGELADQADARWVAPSIREVVGHRIRLAFPSSLVVHACNSHYYETPITH